MKFGQTQRKMSHKERKKSSVLFQLKDNLPENGKKTNFVQAEHFLVMRRTFYPQQYQSLQMLVGAGSLLLKLKDLQGIIATKKTDRYYLYLTVIWA